MESLLNGEIDETVPELQIFDIAKDVDGAINGIAKYHQYLEEKKPERYAFLMTLVHLGYTDVNEILKDLPLKPPTS